MPRSSAFIKGIPYFLNCKSMDSDSEHEIEIEIEDDQYESGFGSIEDAMISSTLFGEMIHNPTSKSGTSTPSAFLDSAKFYMKYCEDTEHRREAEDLMVQTMISNNEQPRPSNDNQDRTVVILERESSESDDSIFLRTV